MAAGAPLRPPGAPEMAAGGSPKWRRGAHKMAAPPLPSAPSRPSPARGSYPTRGGPRRAPPWLPPAPSAAAAPQGKPRPPPAACPRRGRR